MTKKMQDMINFFFIFLTEVTKKARTIFYVEPVMFKHLFLFFQGMFLWLIFEIWLGVFENKISVIFA